jgi:hypothetical protein
MLFFRSEELVREWCEARGVAPNPCVRPRPALDPRDDVVRDAADARRRKRPSPAEMRGIFASIGLTGPFWDPEARG